MAELRIYDNIGKIMKTFQEFDFSQYPVLSNFAMFGRKDQLFERIIKGLIGVDEIAKGFKSYPISRFVDPKKAFGQLRKIEGDVLDTIGQHSSLIDEKDLIEKIVGLCNTTEYHANSSSQKPYNEETMKVMEFKEENISDLFRRGCGIVYFDEDKPVAVGFLSYWNTLKRDMPHWEAKSIYIHPYYQNNPELHLGTQIFKQIEERCEKHDIPLLHGVTLNLNNALRFFKNKGFCIEKTPQKRNLGTGEDITMYEIIKIVKTKSYLNLLIDTYSKVRGRIHHSPDVTNRKV